MTFSFGSIIAILLGIMSGLLIGVIVIVKIIKRKLLKTVNIGFNNHIDPLTRADIELVVKQAQQKYTATSQSKVFKNLVWFVKRKKQQKMKVEYDKIIEDIALIFNPNSKAPIFELSEKQAFALTHSVIEHIRQILKCINLQFICDMQIDTILSSMNIFSNIASKKVVSKGLNVVLTTIKVINLINPFYYIKKLIQSEVFAILFQETHRLMIEVVAKEFANIYCDLDHSVQIVLPEGANFEIMDDKMLTE